MQHNLLTSEFNLLIIESYWPSLQQSSHILNMSHIDAEKCDDTLAALASLSVNNNNNNNNGETDTHRYPT